MIMKTTYLISIVGENYFSLCFFMGPRDEIGNSLSNVNK